jgi:iron(III) transport system permease protein
MGFGFLFAFSAPGVGLYGTPQSLVIAYAVIMVPFAVRYQLSALIAMGKQTTEASRANGAGPIRTFAQVILPLARTGIASAAAIIFVLLVHEFAVSLLLRAPNVTTMSVLLFNEYDAGSYPVVAVIAIVMTAITAVGVALTMLVGGRRAFENM